jgi:hypothetical protein
MDDETMPFKMTLNGSTLTFESGDERQILTRQSASATAKPAPSATASQPLRVNGVIIDPERINKFERDTRMRIPRGDFWYDKVSGAWGIAGGPTLGFTSPGMDLGGPLKEDASRGNTGVFINGRHLPMQDVLGLANMGVPVQQGRWWVDYAGNFGIEGNPQLLGNIFQYSRGKGGAYQRATAGGYIGGDGQTSYFFDPKSGASVMTGP